MQTDPGVGVFTFLTTLLTFLGDFLRQLLAAFLF